MCEVPYSHLSMNTENYGADFHHICLDSASIAVTPRFPTEHCPWNWPQHFSYFLDSQIQPEGCMNKHDRLWCEFIKQIYKNIKEILFLLFYVYYFITDF